MSKRWSGRDPWRSTCCVGSDRRSAGGPHRGRLRRGAPPPATRLPLLRNGLRRVASDSRRRAPARLRRVGLSPVRERARGGARRRVALGSLSAVCAPVPTGRGHEGFGRRGAPRPRVLRRVLPALRASGGAGAAGPAVAEGRGDRVSREPAAAELNRTDLRQHWTRAFPCCNAREPVRMPNAFSRQPDDAAASWTCNPHPTLSPLAVC
jgi:hypothetical protein